MKWSSSTCSTRSSWSFRSRRRRCSAGLGGLGAVSIPVLIHLFSRRRFRVVTWAAMRFLLAAERQNVRRMRLEQYLLLGTRMLILLLLVLAMAAVTPWAEAFWF